MKLMKSISMFFSLICSLPCCSQAPKSCSENCCTKSKIETEVSNNSITPKQEIASQALTCKLMSPELRKRKETVLASLKKKVVARQELGNGYRYNFHGSDNILDELIAFIKTERQCCNFFEFRLIVHGDGKMVILEITGPEGVKKFIETELEM